MFYTGCTSGVYLSFPAADACADCRLGLELLNEAQQHEIMGAVSVGTSLWTQKITSGREKH